MDNAPPKCPQCPDGGNVKRVAENSTESTLAPLPGHVRRAELFQCTCGWTMIRTVPARDTK